jgi:Histone acetyl transferase HAT1 N-terminus
LKINVYLSAATLRPFVEITYMKQHQNHDDIVQILGKHFGPEGKAKSFNFY